MQEENTSLAEFVKDNWLDRAHNYQSRLLLGPEFALGPPKSDAEITAAIRSRFYLIGYTEALELFLFYLHVANGFPLVLFNKRMVRKERAGFRPTEEDLHAIEESNRLDHLFYRCARDEFDRRVAAAWTKEAEWLYAQYLEALKSYRETTLGNPSATPLIWRPHGREIPALHPQG